MQVKTYIELDNEEVNKIFVKKLKQMVGDFYEVKGKVYQEVDTSTSHYSSEQVLVKNAPSFLIHAIRLLDTLPNGEEDL